jgi:hypothetical protein
VGDVEQAKQVIETERSAVLAGLAAERAAAERAAEEQRRWRAEVGSLLERGRAVGVSVSEMADALGISRQWTNHLAKQTVSREMRKRASSMQFGPGFALPSEPDQP